MNPKAALINPKAALTNLKPDISALAAVAPLISTNDSLPLKIPAVVKFQSQLPKSSFGSSLL